MAGTGRTGRWRTGVWVEPLESESTFGVNATGSLSFVGDFEIIGGFITEASASMVFSGNQSVDGMFDVSGVASAPFTGEFTPGVVEGTFAVFARADISESPSFEYGPPGGQVGVKTRPGAVECIVGPGDVVNIGGVAGTVVKNETGQLVVVDSAGAVLCIVPPSGVLLL